MRVEELINPISGSWDEELIRGIFWPIYVHHILKIPLPNYGQSNFIAWHVNKSGSFSVKSAYHLE
jgi:hypothetical protein